MFRYDFWGERLYSSYITRSVFKERTSIEEAALSVLIMYENDRLENTLKFVNFIRAYETAKRYQKEREELFIPKTGERIPFPKYPIKDKKKYNLFKKIYKIAKKDLDEYGKISDKTLEKVKELVGK